MWCVFPWGLFVWGFPTKTASAVHIFLIGASFITPAPSIWSLSWVCFPLHTDAHYYNCRFFFVLWAGTRYGLDGLAYELLWGQEIFCFPHTCIPILGPTQFPEEWVPGHSAEHKVAVAWGWPRTLSRAEVKIEWSYTSASRLASWHIRETFTFICDNYLFSSV